MPACTHSHAHAYNVSTLLCYFSNSEGCGRKLCKNSLQDASLFVPIILYPYLSPPSFPSIVQGGTSGLVNMFIHVHTHSPFSNILRPGCCRGLDNVRIYSRVLSFVPHEQVLNIPYWSWITLSNCIILRRSGHCFCY